MNGDKTMGSVDFANKFHGFELDGKSHIVFITGGAFGLHTIIYTKKSRYDYQLRPNDLPPYDGKGNAMRSIISC